MPPESVTGAGQRFFEQHERDLHFVSSDVRFIQEFQALAGSAAHAILPDKKPREAFPRLFSQVDNLERAARFNDRARTELIATRYVDNYLVYVSDFIGEVFRARPKTLRSAETVRLDEVLQHESIEDLIARIADERVNRLSYKGFGEIEGFVQKRLGFALVNDPQDRRHLVHAIAVRNLLVHRRGIIDSRFLSLLNREGFESHDCRIGERIFFVNNYDSLPAIVSGVLHVEGELVRKFDLPISTFKSTWQSLRLPEVRALWSWEVHSDTPRHYERSTRVLSRSNTAPTT